MPATSMTATSGSAPNKHLCLPFICCTGFSRFFAVASAPQSEESSPRGAYNASTYVLHRCGGCRWMPPLERLLNASRAANGVDDASAADALAAVWETRVLFTGKL